MKHVSTIRQIIAKGDIAEAYEALDNLLVLGPNNVEALKLQAMLFRAEGRFAEEGAVYHRILNVDREDPDAILFLLKQQNEDREHYYFTDDLPGGGRRYMAYPRTLVSTSVIGLFGCITFLTLSRLSERYPELGLPEIMLANFALLVVLPWIGIVITYFRAMKSITVTRIGIEISTRLKSIKHRWNEFANVCLAHNKDPDNPELLLVFIPKDTAAPHICIDMNDETSSVRARSHLIREVSLHAKPFSREFVGNLLLPKGQTIRF